MLNNTACEKIEIIDDKKCEQIKFADKIFDREVINIDEHSYEDLCLLEKRNTYSCDEVDSQQACCDLDINLCCYNELSYVFCRWT